MRSTQEGHAEFVAWVEQAAEKRLPDYFKWLHKHIRILHGSGGKPKSEADEIAEFGGPEESDYVRLGVPDLGIQSPSKPKRRKSSVVETVSPPARGASAS